MKRLIGYSFVLAALILSACMPVNVSPGAAPVFEEFEPPLIIRLNLGKLPALGEEAQLSVTVNSTFGVPEVIVSVVLPDGLEYVDGQRTWQGSLAAGGQVQFTMDLRLVAAGDWTIEAFARLVDPPPLPADLPPEAALDYIGRKGFLYLHVDGAGAKLVPFPVEPTAPRIDPLDASDLPAPATSEKSPGYRPFPVSEPSPETKSDDPAPAAPAGTLTVTGRFAYYNRSYTWSYLRWAKVQAWDWDANSSDDLMATCYTDTEGLYSCGPFNNADGEGGGTELYIVVLTQNNAAEVYDGHNVYNDYTDATYGLPDGTYDMGYLGLNNSETRGAWWIFADMMDGWNFFANDTVPAFVMPLQYVVWPNPFLDGMYFSMEDQIIYVEPPYENDPDPILHEYAHSAMYRAYGNWMPPNDYPGSHTWFLQEGVNHAWYEGWAALIPCIIHGRSYFADTTGGYTIYLETRTDSSRHTWETGPSVDGNVAAALWDLYDYPNDGYDIFNGTFVDIWTVVFNHNSNNISDFWSSWRVDGNNRHLAVQALYQNTIDLDGAPMLNISDRTLNEDETWNNAVDLYTYALDTDSSDDELTFSLVRNSNANIPVTLHDDRYIDIHPLANANGASTVTISVFDGIKSTEDSFLVTVNAVNDVPVLNGIPDRSLNEDATLSNTIELWTYASDVETADWDLIYTIQSVSNPNCGVSIDSNDDIDIDPADNWFGTCDVTVKAADPLGASDTDVFRITVNSINDTPWVSPPVPTQYAAKNKPIVIDLTAFEHDVEDSGASLDWSVTGEDHCTVSGENSSDDVLTFTPSAGFAGADTVTLRLTDSSGGYVTIQLTLAWGTQAFLPLMVR